MRLLLVAAGLGVSATEVVYDVDYEGGARST